MCSKIVGIEDGFLFQLYSGTAKRPNTKHGLLQRTVAILTYYFPQRISHAHCNDFFLAAVSNSFAGIILLFSVLLSLRVFNRFYQVSGTGTVRYIMVKKL
jgi:hypothetical protein